MNLIALTPAAAYTSAPANVVHSPTLPVGEICTDARTLLSMLEEVDYGIALVSTAGALRFANQLALRAFAEGGPLRVGNGMLGAVSTVDQVQLRCALADAGRGLRRMLHLGDGALAMSVAVKPLAVDDAANDAGRGPALAMLVFGKRQACEALTLDIFARTQKLTNAESAVLRGLCAGLRPKQIAAAAGVAVSTVRTQINSIRVKTRTRSIRELAERVAALPPITPAMKSVVCH